MGSKRKKNSIPVSLPETSCRSHPHSPVVSMTTEPGDALLLLLTSVFGKTCISAQMSHVRPPAAHAAAHGPKLKLLLGLRCGNGAIAGRT